MQLIPNSSRPTSFIIQFFNVNIPSQSVLRLIIIRFHFVACMIKILLHIILINVGKFLTSIRLFVIMNDSWMLH
ncbi:MAG: hypothetical protein CBD48_02530 [Cyanobacteria bacterium TMED188]|nr:MAG: hypothetical protein CBD48_02530 [Cyanobacteria bacterium TMED188]